MAEYVEFVLSDGASRGIEAFVLERNRQVLVKGFTPEHDKDHDPAELVAAGKCYIDFALWDLTYSSGDSPPFDWPWGPEAWHPEDNALDNLAKGGALIAAGYDRIVADLPQV